VSVFETRELMPFAPEDLLALVGDVKAYPAFLPWIKATRLSAQKSTPQGQYFVGEAIIGYKAFRASFTTHVDIDQTVRTITTRLIRGPFKSLVCVWAFSPSPSGTLVDLRLEFEFSEPFLASLLAANMDKAVSKLIKAFTAEAERRYDHVEAV
jgi:coenzyme Q-binding protein COQ10